MISIKLWLNNLCIKTRPTSKKILRCTFPWRFKINNKSNNAIISYSLFPRGSSSHLLTFKNKFPALFFSFPFFQEAELSVSSCILRQICLVFEIHCHDSDIFSQWKKGLFLYVWLTELQFGHAAVVLPDKLSAYCFHAAETWWLLPNIWMFVVSWLKTSLSFKLWPVILIISPCLTRPESYSKSAAVSALMLNSWVVSFSGHHHSEVESAASARTGFITF